MALAPLRTVGVPTGRERPGGDIRELYHGTDGTFVVPCGASYRGLWILGI